MKFFFATVGNNNPTRKIPLPEHMGYPVAQRTDDGLDLDYTPLLLCDGFVIDDEMFTRITESSEAQFAPMGSTLTRLMDEGLLETMDMGAVLDRHTDGILRKIDVLLQDPMGWLTIARAQWTVLRPEFAEFQEALGSESMRSINVSHPGVENWLAETDQSDNEALRGRLMHVLEVGESGLAQALDDVAMYDIRGMLRFLIAQILCTDLLRHKLDVPFLNWEDSEPYFDRLYATRWDDLSEHQDLQRQARLLFDVVIPDLKPNNIDKVVRFLRDNKAVTSLREELLARLNAGEDVSKEWLLSYVNEAVRDDIVVQRRARNMRWMDSVAGVAMPGANLVQEIAAEMATSAAEAGGESLVNRGRKRPRWYYALQKIVAN